jgi:ubiquinone/menaquinone biosynthesis C-methylase UbiE
VAGHPLVAALYDPLMRVQDALGLARRRVRTAGEATGRVLELGVGTGLQLPHYTAADEVVGVDPDPHMLRRARGRTAAAPVPVELVEASAERLPFEDASFDTVVASLSLCTVPDQAAALREARRVLRPDGRLVFLEHVRSERPRVAAVQDRVEPLWMRIAGGCHPNRDTVAAIEHEFEVERLWRRGLIVQGSAKPKPGATGAA